MEGDDCNLTSFVPSFPSTGVAGNRGADFVKHLVPYTYNNTNIQTGRREDFYGMERWNVEWGLGMGVCS